MRRHRSPIWNISTIELTEIVGRAESLSEVLAVFGLNNKGGNHKTLRARLEHDKIDFSHIPLGRGSNKQRHRGGSTPTDLDLVLVEQSSYSTNRLKKRLIQSGLLMNKCAECGQDAEWNGKQLVLVLDHINGISRDHRLENLRLLCPNCNSQTPTFCGRNVRQ
jgi:5-methylcytosine-specific restriction endonuclease McrA